MAPLRLFGIGLLSLCYGVPNSLAAAILPREGGPPLPSATGPDSSWPSQIFKTSHLRPPAMNITKRGKTEPGLLFISPRNSVTKDDSAVIVSDDGQLVWQSELGNMFAFQPQHLDGEQVLTYWNGTLGVGFGWGHISVLNSSYDEIHRVTLGANETFVSIQDTDFPSYVDIHEDNITEEGTILVTAVNVTQADLSSLGGPKDGWVQDSLFYEIDIKTNEVLFRWSPLEHLSEVPFSASYLPLTGDIGKSRADPYEYSHLNSVAKYGDTYLISSRYMCSVFLIHKNGTVLWQLEGRGRGDFKLGSGADFCYQHDVRIERQNATSITLHMHNNANNGFDNGTAITTGLVLDLDLPSRSASVARKLWNADDHPVFAYSQGSYQALANGHALLGHGAIPRLEEFDEGGMCVMTAQFGEDVQMQSYRGFRAPWVGRPRTAPSVVACAGGEGTDVYVSWNGATDVQAWNVYGGKNATGLELVKTVERNGFETKVGLGEKLGFVSVEAVGGVGAGAKSQAVAVSASC